MKIKVSTSITPALPEHRTLEAESVMEAVRMVVMGEAMETRFMRCVAAGGGSIVISAFAAKDKPEFGDGRKTTDAAQRGVLATGGQLELR